MKEGARACARARGDLTCARCNAPRKRRRRTEAGRKNTPSTRRAATGHPREERARAARNWSAAWRTRCTRSMATRTARTSTKSARDSATRRADWPAYRASCTDWSMARAGRAHLARGRPSRAGREPKRLCTRSTVAPRALRSSPVSRPRQAAAAERRTRSEKRHRAAFSLNDQMFLMASGDIRETFKGPSVCVSGVLVLPVPLLNGAGPTSTPWGGKSHWKSARDVTLHIHLSFAYQNMLQRKRSDLFFFTRIEPNRLKFLIESVIFLYLLSRHRKTRRRRKKKKNPTPNNWHIFRILSFL